MGGKKFLGILFVALSWAAFAEQDVSVVEKPVEEKWHYISLGATTLTGAVSYVGTDATGLSNDKYGSFLMGIGLVASAHLTTHLFIDADFTVGENFLGGFLGADKINIVKSGVSAHYGLGDNNNFTFGFEVAYSKLSRTTYKDSGFLSWSEAGKQGFDGFALGPVVSVQGTFWDALRLRARMTIDYFTWTGYRSAWMSAIQLQAHYVF